MQESIDTCLDWAKYWQMEFNLSKCKVLGMGKNNEKRDYRMQGVILEEEDLGVVIDTGGKQAAQCQAAIGKENRVLGCIQRGINRYKINVCVCVSVCRCVNACACLLHNSKTMKPSSLKHCMHTKKTPRECMSENWVFGLIKTPLLKIINGLI